MARGIRAIILNSDEEYNKELRSKLLSIEGLKVVSELDEPTLLENVLSQYPAELIVINLDPEPEYVLQVCGPIIEKNPELTFFAVSESNDAQLILQAMRTGFREFLVRPIDDEQLHQAENRICKLLVSTKKQGKIICVFGAAGGVGGTTIAVNLGCELAQMASRSSVIVDLDLLYGHVATLLDIKPQFSIADLCQTLDAIDTSMIEKALIKHETGVSVLARPLQFAQAQAISGPNVTTVLTALSEMYDYVVCDGPPRNSVLGPKVLELADISLMILTLSVPTVRNIDRILREMEREGYNLERIRLVMSRLNNDCNTLTVEDVEQTLNKEIWSSVPEEGKVVSAAVNTGQPLLKLAPKSKSREAIKAIADKIHNPEGVSSEKETNLTGLIAKVLGR